MPINEQQIDDILDQFESGKMTPEIIIGQIRSKQPQLFHFLLSDQFEYLNLAEREYFLFLASVVWALIPEKEAVIHSERIEFAEEENWERFSAQTALSFSDKLNPFFEESEEEDLLAFIEDSLLEGSDYPLSPVGREWMFVGLKTMMDLLL